MPESGNQNYWQQPTNDQQPVPATQPAEAQPSSTPEEVIPQEAPVITPDPVQESPLAPPPPPVEPIPTVTWEAAEFVDHHKGAGWFAAFGLFAVIVICIGIFLLRDWFVTIGFVIMIVAVAAVALRPARTLRYAVDDSGVHVGEKLYPYQDFQSFSVQHDSDTWSIFFMPAARFTPALTVYFNQDQGEAIVDVLGNFLPMEERKLDMIDRFAAKIRF